MDSSEKAEDSPLQNIPSSSLPPASALAWGLGKGEASTTLPPPSRGQRRDPSDPKMIWKVEPKHPTTRVHSKQTGLVVMAPWWRLAQRPFCPCSRAPRRLLPAPLPVPWSLATANVPVRTDIIVGQTGCLCLDSICLSSQTALCV